MFLSIILSAKNNVEFLQEVLSGGANAGGVGSLDFLRNNQQVSHLHDSIP